MKWLLIILWLTGALGAQAPLHIVAVERRGPPPYDPAGRVYGLDGGQDRGLQVGHRLLVKRVGVAVPLGHLQVTQVHSNRSEARFEPASTAYPMKGDLALVEELLHLPQGSRFEGDSLPTIPAPLPRVVAPPHEGLLFFLPQRADLSPAGVRKVEAWVVAWGVEGRWVVQVPATKAIKPALQKQRAETLQSALRSLGIEHVAVEHGPRVAEGRNDPAWIRHWE